MYNLLTETDMLEDEQKQGGETGEPTSRRSVLNKVASVGVGVTALTRGSSAKTRYSTEKVKEKRGRERKRVLGNAFRDPAVKELRQKFLDHGWKPRVGDAKILLTDDEESNANYHTVTIPFETGVEEEQAFIMWTDSDYFPIQGRHYVHIGGPKWQETSYWIEGRSIRTRTNEFEVEKPDTDADVGAQAWCWDINWGCVMGIAGAWMVTISVCATCYFDPTKLTCLECIGAVLVATGGSLGCDWCD